LCITLQDNGIGFDIVVGKEKEGHYGLRNLQERADEMGATLSIESEVGKGTKMVVKVLITFY
jgi:signal transduction histidine kinase